MRCKRAHRLRALPVPHHFYLSPALDVDERTKKHLDQRSLQFARFNGDTVLEATGNYYVAYPREQIDSEQRVRQTLEDVLVPMLRVLVAQFQTKPDVGGYVLEVSHHVRGKVLGVPWETAENVALALPQHSAVKFVAAQNSSECQALLGEVQIFLNSKAITLRPTEKSCCMTSSSCWPSGRLSILPLEKRQPSCRFTGSCRRSLLKNSMNCHPERSEGSAARRKSAKCRFLVAFAPRNDKQIWFFNKLLGCKLRLEFVYWVGCWAPGCALPCFRSRLAFKRPDDVRGHPATVEFARLSLHTFVIDETRVHPGNIESKMTANRFVSGRRAFVAPGCVH